MSSVIRRESSIMGYPSYERNWKAEEPDSSLLESLPILPNMS